MPLDLEELERLLAEATPGLWTEGTSDGVATGIDSKKGRWLRLAVVITRIAGLPDDYKGNVEARANFALILALRNAAPELLALARAAPSSWRAGAGAMREAIARKVDFHASDAPLLVKAALAELAIGIRTMPLPEKQPSQAPTSPSVDELAEALAKFRDDYCCEHCDAGEAIDALLARRGR